jgi:hypothetical protein
MALAMSLPGCVQPQLINKTSYYERIYHYSAHCHHRPNHRSHRLRLPSRPGSRCRKTISASTRLHTGDSAAGTKRLQTPKPEAALIRSESTHLP